MLHKKNSNPFALDVSFDYNYHIKYLPPLLESYHVFKPSFYEKAILKLKEKKININFNKEDLLDNVDYDYAFWVLNHCIRIIDARDKVIKQIENAKTAEAKYIQFETFRPCSSCNRIPKNKRYKITDNIPVYPCEDCKEDNICLFAYNMRW